MKCQLLETSTQTCHKMMNAVLPMIGVRTATPLSLFDVAVAYGCMDAPEDMPAGGMKGEQLDTFAGTATLRRELMVSREQVQA